MLALHQSASFQDCSTVHSHSQMPCSGPQVHTCAPHTQLVMYYFGAMHEKGPLVV